MKNSIKTLDQLNSRLKGFTRTFRGKFLLLQRNILTLSEFTLWDFSFTVLADWDKENHPDTYATFGHTCKEVGLLLGCSPSSISRNGRALFRNGLWMKKLSGRTRVSCFELLENVGTLTKEVGLIDIQQYISGMQKPVAEPQDGIAKISAEATKGQKVNSKQPQQQSQPNIAILQSASSKDSLGVSFKGKSNLPRSYEEYRSIKEVGGPNSLTIDEMIWTDLNVKEEI